MLNLATRQQYPVLKRDGKESVVIGHEQNEE